MLGIVVLAALAMSDPSASTQIMPAGQVVELPAAEAVPPPPVAGEWAGPMISETTTTKATRWGMAVPERPLRPGERAIHRPGSDASRAAREAHEAADAATAAAAGRPAPRR